MLNLYNTIAREKQIFVPITPGQVRMYVCGMTVYDYCHLGHARVMVVFDMVSRWLRENGLQVTYVRNITDIDDKIIQRAAENNEAISTLTQRYIQAMNEDSDALGVIRPDAEPRATEHIDGMVAMISKLIERKLAYVGQNGDVFYSVRDFAGYGKLSGKSLGDLRAGERVEVDSYKRDPLDFVLWKSAKPGEPAWDSPWGKGRPGWHIECSAMSEQLLGDYFDIHGGGADLQFPHHENEIAQSEGLTEKTFAKYWIHHGLLTINGQKMAKSLGNFITIEAAVAKYSADVLKFFFLASHYGSAIDFTEDKMKDAAKAYQRFDVLFWKASEIIGKTGRTVRPAMQVDFIESAKSQSIAAMDDDFNTPQALAALFELVNETNKFIDTKQHDADYENVIGQAVDTLESYCKEIFGLFGKPENFSLNDEQRKLLDERRQAREGKDFKRSDELRQLLKEKGIVVEDGKGGQTWRLI
jgi:cysteinyl-tRNA synthetase